MKLIVDMHVCLYTGVCIRVRTDLAGYVCIYDMCWIFVHVCG